MSTISEALKKAQKQRLGNQVAPVPPPPPSEPPRDIGRVYTKPEPLPSQSSGSPSFLLILVCVAIVVGGVFYYLRGASEVARTAETSQTPVTKPEAPASPPAPEGIVIPPTSMSVVPQDGSAGTPRPTQMQEIPQGRAKPSSLRSPSGGVGPAEPEIIQEVVSQPGQPKAARTDTPVLGGIFYSAKNPVAIINGSAMKEGEMVGVYQVVKISTYSVALKCDGEIVELHLK